MLDAVDDLFQPREIAHVPHTFDLAASSQQELATALSELVLKRIDRLRLADPQRPSRAEIIQEAVDLYLYLHSLPVETFEVIRGMARILEGAEAVAADVRLTQLSAPEQP